MAIIDNQVTKLADLIAETTKPAALLRKIEELEDKRENLVKELSIEIEDEKNNRMFKQVSIAEIKAMLKTLASEIDSSNENLKKVLAQFIKEIVLTTDASSATICYNFAEKSGLQLASPRGFEPRSPP